MAETDDVAELFRKVAQGNVRGIEEMLRFRPELARAADANGLSVLCFARYLGERAALQLLIDEGPSLDVFEASSIDRVADVRAMLDGDASLVAARDGEGLTALHVAARHDCANVTQFLLDRGAEVDARSRNARAVTALHVAVAARATGAMRVLLRAGADPNARNGEGATPLMLAAAAGQREIVEILVARNANVDVRDGSGRTAAELAARRGHRELAARIRLGERVIDRSTS
jgi:ankyrin repeat protein